MPADQHKIEPILTAHGLIPLSANAPGSAPYCEDFNEALCGSSNTPACASNPAGIPIVSTLCGNNITEFGEQCDDGNVTAGDGCDAYCQREN